MTCPDTGIEGAVMRDDGGVSLELLRQMLNANDPEDVARHAREWKDLAREVYEVTQDVDRLIPDLDDSFDSQHAAPALKAKLVEEMNDLDVTAGRIDRNGNLVVQAADAWRRARDAANSASSDRDAQPIRSALSAEHAAIAAQLDLFNEDDPDKKSGGTDGDSGGYRGAGPGSDGGDVGDSFVPVIGGGSGRAPSSGRVSPGPTLGGRPPTAGEKPGTGTGTGTTGTLASAGASTGRGTGGGARVGIPGARSGAPIGGYRPAHGASGTGGAGTPGGSTPAKATPGGPGRPGAVPPGAGPGQPGRDRPGRRLTNYEKLEPNVFRDTRHRVKPVIGEQRRQPDTFEPIPGAIGGKQTGEETRKTPDLPTRESPVRFEGHDVSVSRRSRRAGP